MVHSGGFYTVDRQTSLRSGARASQLVPLGSADDLAEWNGPGFFLVYYSSSGLIDPDICRYLPTRGGLPSGTWSAGRGWMVYDLALRSPLGRSEAGFAVFSVLIIALLAWGLTHVFSGRAAYPSRRGGLRDDYDRQCLVPNSPSQRRMIAVAAAGKNCRFRSRRSSQVAIQTQYFQWRFRLFLS